MVNVHACVADPQFGLMSSRAIGQCRISSTCP
jgi:hypothetical protein